MNEDRPLDPRSGESDRGLGWMLLLSAIVHAAAIAGLMLIPYSFVHRPPRMISYTVELIAPDKLGGTNLIAGAKGRSEAPPKIEPAKAQLPPAPEPAAKKQPEAKPEPPKVEAEKKADDIVLAKATAIAPTQTAAPTPQVVARAVVPTSVPPAPVKSSPARPPSKPPAAAATKPPSPAAAGRAPTPPATARPKEAGPALADKGPREERDDRIAAAIKRVEQQAGVRGGGTGGGASEPGAPLSVGPGEGAGGEVRGIDFLLYKNGIETKIKDKWAWAGSRRALRAVVGFGILETGEVVNIRTVVSSGDATYDRTAERAVQAAAPLPPPPEQYRGDFSSYELTFQPEDGQ